MTVKIGVEAVFLIAEFSRGLSSYTRGLDTAERRTDTFAVSAVRYFDQVGQKSIELGKTIGTALAVAVTGATAALAGLGTWGVNSAADLEEQMDEVRAVVIATDAEMAALQETAIDIGLDPRLRASVFDAADVMEMLARNGVRATDILDGLALQTIALANATGGDFATAADVASDAMFVFGIQASEFQQIADGVTAVVNNSKFDLEDYRYALASAGGVASIVGLSFDDMNAIIADTSYNFASGRTAGTALAVFLQRLVPVSARAADAMQQLGLISFNTERVMELLGQNGVTPASNALEDILPALYGVAQQLGFVTREGQAGEQQFREFLVTSQLMENQFYDTNGALKDGADIVDALNKSLEGLSAIDRTRLMRDAFGQEAIRTAVQLAGGTREEFIALKEELSRASAIDSAAIRVDNFRGALQILEETVQAIAISIGLGLLPTMTEFAKLITTFIENQSGQIISFFAILTAGISEFVASLAAGRPSFSAFTGAISEMLRELGYGAESIGSLNLLIERISSLLGQTLSGALAIVTTNADAFVGALTAITIALTASAGITALVSAIGFLISPMGQVIAIAGILGAAWSTNFLGMRDAVLWFVETIQPAISAVVAFAVQTGTVISQMVGQFVSGFTSIEGQVSTSTNGIMQSLFELGRVAASWGTGLVEVIASGIVSAVGAIVQAINYIGSVIAYMMQPNSPPRYLPQLDQWGTDAANLYLQAWTKADFSTLEDFGDSVSQILQSLVSAGDLKEKDANPMLLALRDQMANAIEELNRTGAVSEATFEQIAKSAGPAGEAVEAYARQFIELNAAIEAARLANERLTNATKEQEKAEKAFESIKNRLEAGDTSVTMDEIRAARERLRTAKLEVNAAQDAADVASEAEATAKSEMDLLEARVGIQNETKNIYGQQEALLARLAAQAEERAKKEKEGLTALELQIKAMEMLMAHYRDRQKLAELDAIIKDKDSNAQQIATAEMEKQLVLLRMQQREVEAAELNIDLSKAYELPIVLEEAVKKGEKLREIDWADMAADIAGVPNYLEEITRAGEGTTKPFDELKFTIDKIAGGIKEASSAITNLFKGDSSLKLPFVDDLNALLDRLSQPIVLPTLDFGSMGVSGLPSPEDLFTKIQEGISTIGNVIRENAPQIAAFGGFILGVLNSTAVLGGISALGTLATTLAAIGTAIGTWIFDASFFGLFTMLTNFIATVGSTTLPAMLSAIGAGFSALGAGFMVVATAVAPFIAAGLAVGALAAAIVANWGTVTKVFDGVMRSLAPVIAAFQKSLTEGLSAFLPLGETLMELFEAWRPTLEAVGTVIATVLVGAMGLLVGLLQGIGAALEPLLKTIATTLEFLFMGLTGLGNIVSGLIEIVVGLFTLDFEKANKAFENLVYGIFQLFAGVFGAVVALVGGALATLVTLVAGFVSGVIQFFQNMYDVLVGNSIVPDLVNAILNWFTTLDDRLWEIANDIWLNVTEAFYGLLDEALIIFEDIYTGISEWVIALATDTLIEIETMWTNVQTAFDIAKTNLLTTVANLIAEIITKFTTTDWAQLGKDLVTDIADAIRDNLGVIGRAARDLVDRLISTALNAIQNLLGGQQQQPAPALPTNARGTASWRGGPTGLAEKGVELLVKGNRAILAGLNGPLVANVPQGTTIFNNNAVREMLASIGESNRMARRGGSIPMSEQVARGGSVQYDNRVIHQTTYQISTSDAPQRIDHALKVADVMARTR